MSSFSTAVDNFGCITLGLPISGFDTSADLIRALSGPMQELNVFEKATLARFRQGDALIPCGFRNYHEDERWGRLKLAPFLPEGFRHFFELFEFEGRPTYVIWRSHHSDMDALTPAALFFRLNSGSTGQDINNRFADSVKSFRSTANGGGWRYVDGSSRELNLPDSYRPRSLNYRACAAIAIARFLVNGERTSTVGIVLSTRTRGEMADTGPLFETRYVHLEVDPLTLRGPLRGVVDQLAESTARQVASEISLEEPSQVAAFVNVQTIDWMGLLVELSNGCAYSNATAPVVYVQEDKSGKFKLDIEAWHGSQICARLRGTGEHGIELFEQFSVACDILSNPDSVPSVVSGLRTDIELLPSLVDKLVDRLRSAREDRDYSELILRVTDETAKVIPARNVDSQSTIVLVADRGPALLGAVVACLREGVTWHIATRGVIYSDGAAKLASKLKSDVDILRIRVDGERVKAGHVSHGAHNGSLTIDAPGVVKILSSGSTGESKVTTLSPLQVANIVGNAIKYLGVSPESRVLMISSAEFDAIYFELFLWLADGRPPVIVRDEERDAVGLSNMLRDRSITHITLTPTLLSLLCESGTDLPKMVLAVGEKLDPKLEENVLLRDVTLFDLYGPSEAGIWTSFRRCGPESAPGHNLIDNIYLRITSYQASQADVTVDEGLVWGQIYIGWNGPGGCSEWFDAYSGDVGSINISQRRLFIEGREDGILKIAGRRYPTAGRERELADVLGGVEGTFCRVYLDGIACVMCLTRTSVANEELAGRISEQFFNGQVLVMLRTAASWDVRDSGKLDIRKMAEAVVKNESALSLYPESLREHASSLLPSPEGLPPVVAQVWEAYLGMPPRSASTFGNSGGNSVIAMQIQVRVSEFGYYSRPIGLAETYQDYCSRLLELRE